MLTEEEKIILKNTDNSWRYITRNELDDLIIHTHKPNKRKEDWRSPWRWHEFMAFNHLFQDIKWEDDEPLEFRNEKGEFIL